MARHLIKRQSSDLLAWCDQCTVRLCERVRFHPLRPFGALSFHLRDKREEEPKKEEENGGRRVGQRRRLAGIEIDWSLVSVASAATIESRPASSLDFISFAFHTRPFLQAGPTNFFFFFFFTVRWRSADRQRTGWPRPASVPLGTPAIQFAFQCKHTPLLPYYQRTRLSQSLSTFIDSLSSNSPCVSSAPIATLEWIKLCRLLSLSPTICDGLQRQEDKIVLKKSSSGPKSRLQPCRQNC